MERLGLLACLLGPTLFWAGYFYYRDRRRPEPPLAMTLGYALGLGSGWLALKLYGWTETWSWSPPLPDEGPGSLDFLLYCLTVIGPLEELVKLLPFALICTRLRHFDEEMDGIVYASAIALGFATLENLYFLPAMEGTARYGRALVSPLVHTVFSSIWGWAYARARVRGRPVFVPVVGAFAAAALLHGFYDYLAMSPVLGPCSAAVVGILWLWRIRLMHKLHLEGGSPPQQSEGEEQ